MDKIMLWSSTLGEKLSDTFIVDGRWKFFVTGLETTLVISLFAVILGFLLGVLIAFGKLSKFKVLRSLSSIYIDIIRGTPTMVQLFLIYFVILGPYNIKREIVAVIAFGINSGAYVAEIIRGGILSVSKGQTEAGRSLGLGHWQTMLYIIMPQAIKNIIPALANEFVVLIKETAVVGYIAKIDLMAAALKVQSLTYDFSVPLVSVAIIYYVIIKILTIFINKLEKKLRKSDMR